MISGFFLIGKEKGSILKVSLEGAFYGLFALIVFGVSYLCGYRAVELTKVAEVKWILESIFNPAFGDSWWFLSAYVILMLLVPGINKVLNQVDKKGFLMILLFCWVVYSIDNGLGGGYFALDRAVFFYAIGAFISRFFDKQTFVNKRFILVFAFIAFYAISTIVTYYNSSFALDLSTKSKIVYKLFSVINVSFLCIFISVSMFCLFYSFTFQSKIINVIASGTFGVYLIHDSLIGRSVIWRGIFKVDSLYNSNLFPLYAIGIVLCVFVVCTLIDLFRQVCFEKPTLRIANRWITSFREKHYAICNASTSEMPSREDKKDKDLKNKN